MGFVLLAADEAPMLAAARNGIVEMVKNPTSFSYDHS